MQKTTPNMHSQFGQLGESREIRDLADIVVLKIQVGDVTVEI